MSQTDKQKKAEKRSGNAEERREGKTKVGMEGSGAPGRPAKRKLIVERRESEVRTR